MIKAQVSDDTGQLLSLGQAAERLSITTRYLHTLLRRGELPTVRIGKRRLIRVRDLDAFVDRHVQDAI